MMLHGSWFINFSFGGNKCWIFKNTIFIMFWCSGMFTVYITWKSLPRRMQHFVAVFYEPVVMTCRLFKTDLWSARNLGCRKNWTEGSQTGSIWMMNCMFSSQWRTQKTELPWRCSELSKRLRSFWFPWWVDSNLVPASAGSRSLIKLFCQSTAFDEQQWVFITLQWTVY